MANNKVQLSDGTVLIDLTSDTVTAETLLGGYTAHDASGNLITGTYADTGGGGQQSPYIDVFNTVSISAANGITFLTNTVANNVGTLSASEAQAGYEGFNIALHNLSVGSSYTINFDFQCTDASWFVDNYRTGFDVWDTNRSDYTNWTDWTENLDRDLLKHNHRITFTATDTIMYLSFNICGLADGRTNYFEITDLYVTSAQ